MPEDTTIVQDANTQQQSAPQNESSANNAGAQQSSGNVATEGNKPQNDCGKERAKIAELKVQIAALQKQLQEAQAGKEAVEGSKSELETQLAQLRQENEELKRRLKRKELIMDKFPDLAQFEARGLLPDAPEDELKDRLKAFHELVQGMTKQAAQRAAEGTVTPPHSASGAENLSEEQLIEMALQAQRNGKMQDYQRYMELLSQIGN